jgi:hypothetical protein
MVKFYTLHNAAGLIRSNKFHDKADAVCVGSFRAEYLNFPIKIYEHKDDEKTCVLVCNPDGSVEKPKAWGTEIHDLGNATSGVSNREAAHILLSAFDEQPITTFNLKAQITEAQVSELEKATGCDIGMTASDSFNAYTQEPKTIHAIETQLVEWGLELYRVSEATVKKNKAHAAMEASEIEPALEKEFAQASTEVTAARKGHIEARASRLPELRVRATMKFGGGLKFTAHCEKIPAEGKKAPAIAVYVDGSKVGEVKDERGAARLISEHAEKAFGKFLKKELA